nr:JAB domain-containing protein [Enterococcus faecalis]
MKQAGEILGIELLDHLIVTSNSYYSFREEGTFWGTWNIETKMHGRKANNCR